PFVDFDIYAPPCDEAPRVIAKRRHPEQKPAVLSVEAAHARLDLAFVPRCHDRAPRFEQTLHVVGMKDIGVLPVPSLDLIQGESRVVETSLIQELDPAVGAGTPNEAGNCVDDKPDMGVERVWLTNGFGVGRSRHEVLLENANDTRNPGRIKHAVAE